MNVFNRCQSNYFYLISQNVRRPSRVVFDQIINDSVELFYLNHKIL